MKNPLIATIVTVTALSLSSAGAQTGAIDFAGAAIDNVYNRTPKEIWISADRTDGKGLGTQLDPYDGSTATKFDTLMTNFQGTNDLHIHLGASTNPYRTAIATRTWVVKPGWTIEGAGRATVIQAAGPVTGITYNQVVIATLYNVETNNVTIKNLKIDCNWSELYQTAPFGSGRVVTDAVTTSASPTVTSATAYFHAVDLHKKITATGIPSNTYIGVINSTTSIGLSSSPTVNTPVNATATATGVSITLVEWQTAVQAIAIWGSHNRVENVSFINQYGSIANLNEPFGISLQASSAADATDDVIINCHGDSPAGNYGSSFALFGFPSPTRILTNSKVINCSASGIQSGTNIGFTTGGVNLAFVKDCVVQNCLFADTGSGVYHDTGSLDGLLVSGLKVIRANHAMSFSSGSDANVQLIGNTIETEHRSTGSNEGFYVDSGVNFLIEGNTVTYATTGHGGSPVQPWGFQLGSVTNATVRNNVIDPNVNNVATGTGITLENNNDPTGAEASGAVGTSRNAVRMHTISPTTAASGSTVTLKFTTVDLNQGSAYDSSTGKFQPLLSGWYSIAAFAAPGDSAGGTTMEMWLEKNGSSVTALKGIRFDAANHPSGPLSISDLVYFNGSTDYVLVRTYLDAGATVSFDTLAYMSGFVAFKAN